MTFTIAYEVSDATVAAILEKSRDLVGVSVEEEYIRKYVDQRAGAAVEIGVGGEDPEPWGDITASYSPGLTAFRVEPAEVPHLVDEVPILALLASQCRGKTVFREVGELRVKESDRIATMAAGLCALGVDLDEAEDGATIRGRAGTLLPGGARIDSHGDHRIAMAFAVAGQRSERALVIDDVANVATSFPGFEALARDVGFVLDTR